jgi:two-component system, cell cycle sensor histidine kinase and response regulator CckA
MKKGETRMEEIVRLAPRMAHEILDELSIAQGAIDVLVKDKSIAPEVCEKLALIKGQIRQAGAPAIQLLEITKTKDSHLHIIDVTETLLEIARLLRRLLGRDIKLQIKFEPSLWPIKVATDQFEHVFCILAVNARHAMPNGGILRIRATNVKDATGETGSVDTAPADYVSIEIEDTGIGIPESALDRIFEPFFTTKGPGCGLGLAKVYSIIKSANGQITAKSKVGKGTTFGILLPRHGRPPHL